MSSRSQFFAPLTASQQGSVVAAELGAFQPIDPGLPVVREDRDDDEVMEEPQLENEVDVYEDDEESDDEEGPAGVPLQELELEPNTT